MSLSALRRIGQLRHHFTSAVPIVSSTSPTTQPFNTNTLAKHIHTTPYALKNKMTDITMIPGPIEFDPEVLSAMSHQSVAHNSPQFVEVFGSVLTDLRALFKSTDPKAQPFVIAGGGTLGWEIVGANLLKRDDKALVISTGFFSDAFADCLKVFCDHVDVISAPAGEAPSLGEIETALKKEKYNLITLTHVDTSSGVVIDIKAISELVHKVSPDTLVVVDGVCSVGVEPISFDDWGLDFVLTAPQKAIGAPAGLSISMASPRAVAKVESLEKIPVYFGNLKKWLPIMQAYEARKPAYFSTPAVQNVYALQVALKQILHNGISLDQRFENHKQVSDKIKKQINDWGLEIIAKPGLGAHGLTCIYLPEGVTLPDFLPKVAAKGVTLAGGLFKGINTKYFRFGHMGVSAVDPKRDDVDRTLKAIHDSLVEAGFKC